MAMKDTYFLYRSLNAPHALACLFLAAGVHVIFRLCFFITRMRPILIMAGLPKQDSRQGTKKPPSPGLGRPQTRFIGGHFL